MRRIERNQRREAVTPVGDVAERLRIGREVRVEYFQVRTHRPRIGERLADMQTHAFGGFVECMDHQRIVVPGDDDSRFIGFTQPDAAEEALDPIDGQARQPQAEDTTTVQRTGTHHISIP